MSRRDELATILETIAKDGLPGPRDLDVAFDAIEALYARVWLLESDKLPARAYVCEEAARASAVAGVAGQTIRAVPVRGNTP